jgi:GT2 family glycosyltransferase
MMSIVVATRDRLPYLRACVDSIRAQRYPRDRMELVVVDDCSTDGTAAYLATLTEPWVRVVRQSRPRGFAARNEGVELTRGELVAITDDDCTVADDWLPSLAAAMAASGADGLGGHIDAPADVVWIRYLSDMGFLHPNLLPAGDPGYLNTASACFRRAALHRVGPFDEALGRTGCVDVDISVRMRLRGMRLAYAPGCRVSHFYSNPPDVRGMLRRTYRAGAGWRVLLDKHGHWEQWTPGAAVALAWVVRRRGSVRGFLELPDPGLRPWFRLLNWLQQLCFLAGYVGVTRTADIAGQPAAPAAASPERTRALLAMLSESVGAARAASPSVTAEMGALDVDTVLEAAVPTGVDLVPAGAAEDGLPAATVADWMERHRQLERDYLARNVALLATLPDRGRGLGPAALEDRCHEAGVDVKRFLAWYGSLPRDADGALLDGRRPVQVPRGWREFSRLAAARTSRDRCGPPP